MCWSFQNHFCVPVDWRVEIPQNWSTVWAPEMDRQGLTSPYGHLPWALPTPVRWTGFQRCGNIEVNVAHSVHLCCTGVWAHAKVNRQRMEHACVMKRHVKQKKLLSSFTKDPYNDSNHYLKKKQHEQNTQPNKYHDGTKQLWMIVFFINDFKPTIINRNYIMVEHPDHCWDWTKGAPRFSHQGVNPLEYSANYSLICLIHQPASWLGWRLRINYNIQLSIKPYSNHSIDHWLPL